MEQLNYANTFEIIDEEDLEEFYEIEDNKKSIITFSKLNKYFLIPFLCPVFFMLTAIFEYLISKDKVAYNRDFLSSIFTNLYFIFAGLFYLIPYFKVNFNKKNVSASIVERNNSEEKYLNNIGKIDKYKSCKISMLIILLSLIIVAQDFLVIYLIDEMVFDERIYELFLIPLFSKFILNENIYKHHYFALIISIIGVIFLLIPVCLYISMEDIIPNILNLTNGITYSLFLVIIKYIIEKYYIHPLKICLLIGIVSLFFTGIVFIIYSLIKYNDLSYFNDSFDFFQKEIKFTLIIYIILYILFNMIAELLCFLAFTYFSPTLLVITIMITPFIAWIIESIKNGVQIPDDVLYPIGYIIVIFSAFIYNEIIIFNFCGLNRNTKKFVNQRLDKEIEEIKNTKHELLSSNGS